MRRDLTLYPNTAVGRASTFAPTLDTGRELTPEERIAQLEAGLASTRQELAQGIGDAKAQAVEEAGTARGQAMQHADDLDRSLRDFIAASLGGSRARLGVGSFALGLVLSALAGPLC